MKRRSFTSSKVQEPLGLYLWLFFFDTEALLVPIPTPSSAPNASGLMKLEKHVPCGYAIVMVEHGSDNVLC